MKKCRLKEIQEPVHNAAGSEFKPLDFQGFVSQFVTKGKDFMSKHQKAVTGLQFPKRKGTYRLKKPLPT